MERLSLKYKLGPPISFASFEDQDECLDIMDEKTAYQPSSPSRVAHALYAHFSSPSSSAARKQNYISNKIISEEEKSLPPVLMQSQSASDLEFTKFNKDNLSSFPSTVISTLPQKTTTSTLQNSASFNDLGRFDKNSNSGSVYLALGQKAYLPRNPSVPDSRRVRTVTWGSDADEPQGVPKSWSATDVRTAVGKPASAGIVGSSVGYHITGEQYDLFSPVVGINDKSALQSKPEREEQRENDLDYYPKRSFGGTEFDHHFNPDSGNYYVGDEDRYFGDGDDMAAFMANLVSSGGTTSAAIHTEKDDDFNSEINIKEDLGQDEYQPFCEPIIFDYSIANIILRIAACKENAEIAVSHGMINASNLWSLLAQCLSTLAINLPTTADHKKCESSMSQNRSSGLLRSWRDSAIGLLLLKQLLVLCETIGDIQTFATAICVLGGPAHLSILLSADHPYFYSCSPMAAYEPIKISRDIIISLRRYNCVLLAYCDVLHRWGNFLLYTEVCRF